MDPKMRSLTVFFFLICSFSLCDSLPAQSVEPAPANKLTVGVAQLTLEPALSANRDKIASFIRQAKERGCRVVVFPETSLYWPPGTPREQVDAAVAALQAAADEADLYALIGGLYQRDGKEKPYERLLVVGPDGKILQTYNKLWHDARFPDAPGLFEIEGIPCAATLCADRWIRSVEELPAAAGAKILIECSNNYENEWLEDLGWYWYVPRALRNEVFVVFANTAHENRAQAGKGHGHSAIIRPDGSVLASAGGESDKLLVAELDLAAATGCEAAARRDHPLFKDFWQTGLEILSGAGAPSTSHDTLTSPTIELKIAAAQMACSRRIDDNLAAIERMIAEARKGEADVVVFPELALTGARDDDIAAARQEDLQQGLERIQQAARESQIYVVCGLPWTENGRRQNSAIAIGPDGKLLTRYAQLVVDRPELFAAGKSTRAMWFDVRGVPCVVTIGRDALWSELAELAALRGAQVHLHLAYGRDVSPAAGLLRKQLWVNLASFRTFTATVNAASPDNLPMPSSPASGGSAIWEDYHRAAGGKAGGYAPHSAVRLAEAKQEETILFAAQRIPKVNPQFRILTEKTNPQMTPWYAAGARAIYTSAGAAPAAGTGPYFGGKFRGRIAYSADGNHNDPDDWIASPMALAILAQAGLKDRLVHFDYNCILPQTDAEWEKIHAASVLGAAERYGYDKALFHDCRQNVDAAVASLAKAIDASTADDPLYFVVAGPMEVPLRAIQKTQPASREHVYCISHSRWNDGFASGYKFTNTKRSVIEAGVNWVQIRDQNRLLSNSPYGKPAAPEAFSPWHWMRDSADTRLAWLFERMLVSTRPDPSDAGMMYFLVTGDEEADPAKLRRLLEDEQVPSPIAARKQIRLEAENFRHLDGLDVEDTGDRAASHRLQVKLTREKGRLSTRLLEPYAAAGGRWTVQVRYFDDPERKFAMKLFVDGGPAFAWQSAGKSSGWTTYTLEDVPTERGSDIVLEVEGAGARLDYVQLDR
jgi:predicted amidohydrolase